MSSAAPIATRKRRPPQRRADELSARSSRRTERQRASAFAIRAKTVLLSGDFAFPDPSAVCWRVACGGHVAWLPPPASSGGRAARSGAGSPTAAPPPTAVRRVERELHRNRRDHARNRRTRREHQ